MSKTSFLMEHRGPLVAGTKLRLQAVQPVTARTTETRLLDDGNYDAFKIVAYRLGVLDVPLEIRTPTRDALAKLPRVVVSAGIVLELEFDVVEDVPVKGGWSFWAAIVADVLR